ncbi:MAG: EVE domain-containing protein [bacterium]|nr:EVE domain-containing protein [bacterium]
MDYWLFKTEPGFYSWQDLVKEPDRTACWKGVRNYKARNLLRDRVEVGDMVLFYHSVDEPPVIPGIATVVTAAYPDHYAWDPSSRYFDQRTAPGEALWLMVDIQAVRSFDPPITKLELKAESQLRDMIILKRGTRLSIQPVLPIEWDAILALRS